MSDAKVYDVAVAGGGLAGLCMAIQSATAGYTTVLFEKEQYPFHKVCGEYISMESYSFLQGLGFHPAALDVPVINKLLITDAVGKAYKFDLPLGGFGISRYTLDKALYDLSVSKGAVVIQSKVNDIRFQDDQFYIDNPAHPCYAKVAVGSFGKRANLDIKWQRSFTKEKRPEHNYVGVKYHVRYPHPANEIALHNFDGGYCGISQIENDQSCLCYLTTAAKLQQAGSISSLQEKILGANPHLESIFSQAEFLYDAPLAISQISFSSKSVVHDHVLLAGDAAGLITPLCGNGMSMAMHASKLAFEVSSQYLEGNISRSVMEDKYRIMWRNHFGKRLAAGRFVQRFFGRPAGTAMFLKLMHAIPSLAKEIIKSTHGKAF